MAKIKRNRRVKQVEVTKGVFCLDCGKKISQEKFAEQEGLCDDCHGPFMEEVSQEEYPVEMYGE